MLGNILVTSMENTTHQLLDVLPPVDLFHPSAHLLLTDAEGVKALVHLVPQLHADLGEQVRQRAVVGLRGATDRSYRWPFYLLLGVKVADVLVGLGVA